MFYYHLGLVDIDIEQIDPKKNDPEYLEYTCLSVEDVEKLLNETVEQLSNNVKVTPSLAKVLLIDNKWKTNEIIEQYCINASDLLIQARIKPQHHTNTTTTKTVSNIDGAGATTTTTIYTTSSSRKLTNQLCTVCAITQSSDKHFSLSCEHAFCRDCWSMHFETQINQGNEILELLYFFVLYQHI